MRRLWPKKAGAGRPRRPKKLLGATARERWAARAYLAPSLAGVTVFFLWPFGKIIYNALIDYNGQFAGFGNILNVLGNQAFQSAAANTFKFSLTAVPLAVVLSLMLAMVLEAKIPGKSRFRTFFLSPMMVPVASVVLIWQVIFHQNGALNGFLSGSGLFALVRQLFGLGEFKAVDWLQSDYSQMVVVLLFLWKNLGYNMILFMSALSNIPREQIEAASVDGAGAFRRFWSIKFRYLSPSLLFVTILSLINSFKVFREVYLLAGNYPYDQLYLLQNFMNNIFRALDYQKLSAAALVMAAVMVLIIGALFIIEDRFGRDMEQ